MTSLDFSVNQENPGESTPYQLSFLLLMMCPRKRFGTRVFIISWVCMARKSRLIWDSRYIHNLNRNVIFIIHHLRWWNPGLPSTRVKLVSTKIKIVTKGPKHQENCKSEKRLVKGLNCPHVITGPEFQFPKKTMREIAYTQRQGR